MEFIRLNNWIHSYYFPISDYFLGKEDQILNLRGSEKQGYKDTRLNDNEISSWLDEKFKFIANKYYNLSPVIDTYPNINIYFQDDVNYASEWHNHSHLITSLCAVTYLNLPEEGGEIQFMLSNPDEIFTIKPQINTAYFFPHWLYHRPLPQKDKNVRICFNWNHSSTKRPVHHLTGDIF